MTWDGQTSPHLGLSSPQTPLLWLSATLVAYVIGDAVSARLGRHPLANPVVIAAAS